MMRDWCVRFVLSSNNVVHVHRILVHQCAYYFRSGRYVRTYRTPYLFYRTTYRTPVHVDRSISVYRSIQTVLASAYYVPLTDYTDAITRRQSRVSLASRESRECLSSCDAKTSRAETHLAAREAGSNEVGPSSSRCVPCACGSCSSPGSSRGTWRGRRGSSGERPRTTGRRRAKSARKRCDGVTGCASRSTDSAGGICTTR